MNSVSSIMILWGSTENQHDPSAMLMISLCCLSEHLAGDVIGALKHPLVCHFGRGAEQVILRLIHCKAGWAGPTDLSRTFVGLIQHPILNHMSLYNVAALALRCSPVCPRIY